MKCSQFIKRKKSSSCNAVTGRLKEEVSFELGLERYKNENIGANASQELLK